MGKYRKLLVAVDGSDTSIHALKESFKLAVNEGSWITVVSVVPPYSGDLDLVAVGNVISAMRKPCEDALLKVKEIAGAEKASVKTVCEEGEPYERIVDLADAENSDLIIMGRRGLHRLARALVGSVTARVIGYSRKDVLVVPKDAAVGWQNILIATDGSKYSDAAVTRAIDFAKSYRGELKIVSVIDVPSEFYAEAPQVVEEMARKAKSFADDVKKKSEAFNIKTSIFTAEGEAYEVITRLAKDERADVIVMGSHGRTGLKRLLMGSVAEKTIGHSPCPVLVVKS